MNEKQSSIPVDCKLPLLLFRMPNKQAPVTSIVIFDGASAALAMRLQHCALMQLMSMVGMTIKKATVFLALLNCDVSAASLICAIEASWYSPNAAVPAAI